MQILKNKTLITKHQKSILYDVFYKNNNQPKPLVIFCHGFKGYKDWGAWNIMAAHFANNNLFFVKFNFSHNGGTVDNPIDFPDLEAFSNNNYSLELDDLGVVVNHFLVKNNYLKNIDTSNIILIGHSRGGGIVTLKASEDTRIKTVITYAGISDIASRFPTGYLLKTWKTNDVAYIENSRTKQQMPLKYQMYEDFIQNKNRLNIKSAVTNLKANHLIIHGGNDTVVLLKEAENLHQWNPSSELFNLEDMDHGLGNKQPWLESEMPSDLKKVVNKSIDYINK